MVFKRFDASKIMVTIGEIKVTRGDDSFCALMKQTNLPSKLCL